MTPPVTAHAVLRWITRIYGDDLRPEVKQFGRDGHYRDKAEAAARRIGMSFEDIQLTIAPPGLWADIRSGLVQQIRHGSMTLLIKGGQVCTVTAHNARTSKGRLKIQSDAEIRRGHARFNRRGGKSRVDA